MRRERKNRSKEPQPTLIAEGVKVFGEIKGKGILRVDGFVQGNLEIEDRIIIGEKGHVKGDISCGTLDVEGKVEGVLKVKTDLSVRKMAIVQGEVETGTLSIEQGAMFTATSSTSGTEKNIKKIISKDSEIKNRMFKQRPNTETASS